MTARSAKRATNGPFDAGHEAGVEIPVAGAELADGSEVAHAALPGRFLRLDAFPVSARGGDTM